MSRKATPESVALNARIALLKAEGHTWAQIGERVGITKQAAQARGMATKASAQDVIALRSEVRRLRLRLARIRAILEEVDG